MLPQWSAAVQNYLAAVGINARISQLQVGAVIKRSLEGSVPIGYAAWGSYSINDVSAFLPYFFTGGASDYARDATVQDLVEQGGASTDPATRRKFYGQAIRRITEQAYFVPITTYVTTYGFARNLNFKPHPDELPRFYQASWR